MSLLDSLEGDFIMGGVIADRVLPTDIERVDPAKVEGLVEEAQEIGAIALEASQYE